MTEHGYYIDPDNHPRNIGGVNRYVIVNEDDRPIIETRSNGSDTWLTYRSLPMAARGVARVKAEGGIDAHLYDKQAGMLSEDHDPIKIVPHRRWPDR